MNNLFQSMVLTLKPTVEIHPFEALPMDSYVLVIAASSGKNLDLAHRFSESFTEKGVATQVVDLTTLHWPVYTPELDGDSEREPNTDDLSDLILNSEALVVCAPEYNGSIPPIFTSALAWLSVQEEDFRDLFNGRPIAIASFSGGGGMELLLSMRIQLTHLGAQVVGRQLMSNNNKPAKDQSIEDLIKVLIQMNPIHLEA